jgi:hypothetical protein
LDQRMREVYERALVDFDTSWAGSLWLKSGS